MQGDIIIIIIINYYCNSTAAVYLVYFECVNVTCHSHVCRSVMYRHIFSCLASLARSVSRIEVLQGVRDSMTPVWLQVWSSGLRLADRNLRYFCCRMR